MVAARTPLLVIVRVPVDVIAVLSTSREMPAPAFKVMLVTPLEVTYPLSLASCDNFVGYAGNETTPLEGL